MRTLARSLLLALAASSLSVVAHAAPQPMTRQQIIDLGKTIVGYSYYWGHGGWVPGGTDVGSCSGSCPGCTHSGQWGADCSGFVAKAWQIPSPSAENVDAHPYATVNFANDTTHWKGITRDQALAADALTYNTNGAGHIFLYESGDAWNSMWTYECKGCAAGCVHDLRTAGSAYNAIRRDSVDDGPPAPPTLDAMFVGESSDQMADPTGAAQFQACAGSPIQFSFELANTGGASWVDWGAMGTTWGQDVRLGAPDGTTDPLTGGTRLSVADNANPDVHPPTWMPPGGDCNDAATCQRTVFSATGTAPATPGVVTTKWRLVDEGRAWFGPDVWLSFNIVDCSTGPGAGGMGPGPGPVGAGGGGVGGGGPGVGGASGGSPTTGAGGAHGGTPGQAGHAGIGGSPHAGQGGIAAPQGIAGASSDDGDESDGPAQAPQTVAISPNETEASCGCRTGHSNSRSAIPSIAAVLALIAARRRKRGDGFL